MFLIIGVFYNTDEDVCLACCETEAEAVKMAENKDFSDVYGLPDAVYIYETK